MTSPDLWLHRGQRVVIHEKYFEGRTGKILLYDWVTQNYFVILDGNNYPTPFRPSEVKAS